jgi:hypothetical protein
MMNKNQQIVLGVGFLLVAICCLFAPWRLHVVRGEFLLSNSRGSLVYSPIFLEPLPDEGFRMVNGATEAVEVAVYRLDTLWFGIEVVMIFALTAIATLAFSKRNPNS